METILTALALAFVAGLLVALVAIAVYNEYGDWAATRRINAIADGIAEDFGAYHELDDYGDCVCGFSVTREVEDAGERWYQGKNAEALRARWATPAQLTDSSRYAIDGMSGLPRMIAATNTASVKSDWDNLADKPSNQWTPEDYDRWYGMDRDFTDDEIEVVRASGLCD